jgi:hypothetical protein
MSMFADNHFLISMLFTLSIGICLFMYIHQKYNIIEKKMAELNQYLVQWIQQIQKPHTQSSTNTYTQSISDQKADDDTMQMKSVQMSDDKIDISDDDNTSDEESDESCDDEMMQKMNGRVENELQSVSSFDMDTGSSIHCIGKNTDGDEDIDDNRKTVKLSEDFQRSANTEDLDESEHLEDDEVSDEFSGSVPDYKNMQVYSLKELIKSLGITVKSIAKYKKIELIQILDSYYHSGGSIETMYVNDSNDYVSNGDDTHEYTENRQFESTKSTVVLDNVFLQEETDAPVVDSVEINNDPKE